MNVLDAIHSRYSCKHFDGRAVPKELLNVILEAGRLAPTARNLQKQRIYVLQSPEALATFDRICPCRYGAGTVLICAYSTNGIYVYRNGKFTSGMEDVSIITTYMMLTATSLGINSCWLNHMNTDDMAKALQLPEDEIIVCALALGYAAPEGKPLPAHFARKPLSETVEYR